MKSLSKFINEGIFFKKIKGTKIPVQMPNEYKSTLAEFFSDIKDKVKTEDDVKDFMMFAADEFWDKAINDFNWDPYKMDNKLFSETVWPYWKDEIIKIALK